MIFGKKGTFLEKDTKSFTTPYSIPFLSVLHQNKALHKFHKTGQQPIARNIKGLNKGRTIFSNHNDNDDNNMSSMIKKIETYQITLFAHSNFPLN